MTCIAIHVGATAGRGRCVGRATAVAPSAGIASCRTVHATATAMMAEVRAWSSVRSRSAAPVATSVTMSVVVASVIAATPATYAMVVRIRVIPTAVPTPAPATVIAVVPEVVIPAPVAIVTVAWVGVPPWIPIAVIPVEGIVEGVVISRIPHVHTEVGAVESTNLIGITIGLVNIEGIVNNRQRIAKRIVQHRCSQGHRIDSSNRSIYSRGGFVLLVFLATIVVGIQVPIVVCVGRPRGLFALLEACLAGILAGEVDVVVLCAEVYCCRQAHDHDQDSENQTFHHCKFGLITSFGRFFRAKV